LNFTFDDVALQSVGLPLALKFVKILTGQKQEKVRDRL